MRREGGWKERGTKSESESENPNKVDDKCIHSKLKMYRRHPQEPHKRFGHKSFKICECMYT